MSKKNKKIPPKRSYEEMKQYLEFLDECMCHLVENRIIFRDFYSALMQQKANMNPFISWSLNNYKNNLIIGLCKMLEWKQNNNLTLRDFVNGLRLRDDNRKELKDKLTKATICVHSMDTGEDCIESVSDILLEAYEKIDFDKDIAKIDEIHSTIRNYRNMKIAHQIQASEGEIDIPNLTTLNGYIDDLLNIIKQYHSLFRYYMDFGENKKEFYFNFHLTLR